MTRGKDARVDGGARCCSILPNANGSRAGLWEWPWVFLISWMAIGAAGTAIASTAAERRTAYVAAVGYLRSQSAGAWIDEEARALLLSEAIAVDPIVSGPRAASQLGSLELQSIDARGRRARTLASLQLDESLDLDANITAIALPLPQPLLSSQPTRHYGQTGTQLPIAIDNAFSIQSAGFPPVTDARSNTVRDAAAFLIDQIQLADGSWPLVQWGDADAGGLATGDVAVTAEVVRAFRLFESKAWFSTVGGPASLAAAVNFLATETPPANAADAALRLLALLEPDGTDPAIGAAIDDLLNLQSPPGSGIFEDSVYATALAAQALLRAADFPAYAFPADGDLDGDGVCDPGKTGPECTGEDAFPLDPNEAFDSDHDGIGDTADPDKDGDGQDDSQEPAGFATNPLEVSDTDGDGTGDVADADDDGDSIADVDELFAGLDPSLWDTDGDTFADNVEQDRGTGAADPNDYPAPDADIYPLGHPDGVVDHRDALLALRIIGGHVTPVDGESLSVDRHGDVAPLAVGDGSFDAADGLVILRIALGDIAPWP